jgi:hypothetical protein
MTIEDTFNGLKSGFYLNTTRPMKKNIILFILAA